MDWVAGARGGLEVLLALVDVTGSGVVVGSEAGSGAVRSLAGGLGFSEVELPLFRRASCALSWDHLPFFVSKPHRKASISGFARILYRCFLFCPGSSGMVRQ